MWSLLLVFVTGAHAGWQDGHAGTSRVGKVLKKAAATAPSDCYALCAAHEACLAWTWSTCSAVTGSCTMSVNEASVQYLPEYHTTPTTLSPCKTASGLKSAVEGLVPLQFVPVPLGTVKVSGWLQRQLKVMANGLSGHLDSFWPDVNESVWIGGTADHRGAGHERGPYWLNGMVPLAAQLNATGDSNNLDVDINAQVNHWISYILEHQLPSGWLGPDDGFGGKGNDYWTGWNTAASLLQYADAQGVGSPMGRRCGKAVLDYIAEVNRRMVQVPTTAWTQNRWQDWAYIIHWALEQDPQEQEQMLWDAAVLTQQQSWDWDAYYNQLGAGTTGAYVGKPMPKFPTDPANVNHWDMYDHGVNNAMGTKSCAVWYRHTKNESDKQQSYKKLQMQDDHQGQPHGMFSADECFGGRALNRGIELCAVVEQMYSLQHMFRVHGDTAFLDRQERIAFNSLPGTLTADMWAHQYLQQANEINGLYDQVNHPWQTDGPDSTGFGVAPNFGCCTANYQQGWPKYVNNLFLVGADSALVVAMLAPFTATHAGSTVVVDTHYPFGDTATITVTGAAATLKVRIPGWADKATIAVNGGAPTAAANGTLAAVPCTGSKTTIVLALNPEIRVETGWGLPAQLPVPAMTYSANGASVAPTFPSNFTFKLGAASAYSKLKGDADIRSGDPGQVSEAILKSLVVGQGHYLDSVSLSFRYVAGYMNVTAASTVSLVVVDEASGNDVKTIYTSPPLNQYSFDPFKGYSPPINATLTGLQIPNGNLLQLVLRFTNNAMNVQIPVGQDQLVIKVGWTDKLSPQPAASGSGGVAKTNAAAVLRGPLLFGLTLEEIKSVVKVWAPFNNTDFNLTTTQQWNYALVLNKPMEFVWSGSIPNMPFDNAQFPGVIKATARAVNNWAEDTHNQAANEPPASPLKCDGDSCGEEVPIVLVPYGSTNLRISGMPWL